MKTLITILLAVSLAGPALATSKQGTLTGGQDYEWNLFNSGLTMLSFTDWYKSVKRSHSL